MSSATTVRPCPNCSAPATGRYCSECGAAVSEAICTGCRSLLTPGARFCHRCGTAGGTRPFFAPPQRNAASVLPWGVAAIALLALVAFLAGQRFGGSRESFPATPVADAALASGSQDGKAPH